jgi:membrane-bound ClpP family serine protease
MSSIVWAVILIAGGIGVILLEMFIPSGGILGLFAALSIVSGVVVAFMAGLKYGTIALVAVAVIVPVVVMLMLKWWPETAFGKMILIPDRDRDQEPNPLAHLVGRHGLVRKQMMPNGQIMVDDRTFDAVSQGTLIEEGTSIVVVTADGNRILVRPVLEGEEEVARETSEQDDDISMSDDIADVVDDSSFEDPFA